MTTETDPGSNPNPAQDTTAAVAKPETGTTTASDPGKGQGEADTAAGTKAADTKATDAEGKKPEADADKGKTDDKGASAPESYEAFTVPEGFTLEGDRLSTATEFFKANNWTQEQAQQAIDLYTQMAGEDADALTVALEAQRTQQIEQWGTEAKAELGDKYDETVGYARTAVQAVNDPALTKAFDEIGWGNHPALIKAFAFFGKLARDSSVDGIGGATANGAPKSLAERMYPNMK